MDDTESSTGSDGNMSQVEVDQLVGDTNGRGAMVQTNHHSLDEDSQGDDDLEPKGKEHAGDNPSSSKEVEQRVMVSIYLIPSMKPISIVYFGLTKN
jgi:hypothetical protein